MAAGPSRGQALGERAAARPGRDRAQRGQGEWELPISISHRSESGLAATPAQRALRIGADLEIIAPRDAALVRQFFTDREADLVEASPAGRDTLVARIWSAKEAVLKLLGLGLRLDTRALEVRPDGRAFPECPAGWQPVDVQVRATLPDTLQPRALRVAWCRDAESVLTVAVAG